MNRYDRAAEAGGVWDWYDLGMRYKIGRRVPQKDELAVKWLERAAKANCINAHYELGVMHKEGRGAPEEGDTADEAAVKWYTSAAKAGHSCAQIDLARMYVEGRGTPVEGETADETTTRWLKLAAKTGQIYETYAQYLLGFFYQEGRGTPPPRRERLPSNGASALLSMVRLMPKVLWAPCMLKDKATPRIMSLLKRLPHAGSSVLPRLEMLLLSTSWA